MWVYVSVWVCAQLHAGACRAQKETLATLWLEPRDDELLDVGAGNSTWALFKKHNADPPV